MPVDFDLTVEVEEFIGEHPSASRNLAQFTGEAIRRRLEELRRTA